MKRISQVKLGFIFRLTVQTGLPRLVIRDNCQGYKTIAILFNALWSARLLWSELRGFAKPRHTERCVKYFPCNGYYEVMTCF